MCILHIALHMLPRPLWFSAVRPDERRTLRLLDAHMASLRTVLTHFVGQRKVLRNRIRSRGNARIKAGTINGRQHGQR